MRGGRLLAAGVFLLGLATMIEAQQPNRQRGQGGFGGGFGRGGVDVYTVILTNDALQDEVKVTADQKEKFKTVAAKQKALQDKQAEAFRGAGAKGGKGKGGFDREKFAEMAKERQAVSDEAKTLVMASLTSDQKARLKQIEAQVLGVRAFTNEEIVAALKLTDEQKDKIKGITEEYTKDSRELFGQGGGFRPGQAPDPEKMAELQKKQRRLQRDALDKVVEVLTPEQKAEWKKMTGDPFDTTKLQPQFRRKD